MTHDAGPSDSGQGGEWWRTVSIRELANCRTVVAKFLDGTGDTDAVETEAFSRALAIQWLCFQPGLLFDVIGAMEAKLNEHNRAQKRSDLERASNWLLRRERIEEACRRCIEWARPQEVGELEAKLTHVSLRAQLLNGELAGRTVRLGTATPFKPMHTRRPRGGL